MVSVSQWQADMLNCIALNKCTIHSQTPAEEKSPNQSFSRTAQSEFWSPAYAEKIWTVLTNTTSLTIRETNVSTTQRITNNSINK